ncbi:MAG TPA: NADH-quinone oxidoreductase subunit NuoF [Anaerolineales bacterium]|nr:NADH-quinone oxidoreductase subunit NuoF [Anaerolineales bacterium]
MKVIRSMVLVSMDDASLEHGAEQVFHTFLDEIEEFGLSDQITVSTIRDVGLVKDVPVVIVYPDSAVYAPVKIEDVHTIVEEHLYKGNIVPSLLAMMHEMVPEVAWTRGRRGALPIQKRVVLERSGVIDPASIEDYILYDGFRALGKALTQMTPDEVMDEVEKSGLQGRGGAGFPTGRKWRFVSSTPGNPKYVICNADESEPGTFKDRLIIEGDPFSIIEAMTIAGYAIGSHDGYIYIRGEYPLAYRRIEHAIQQAEEWGLLGEHIFGADFNFHIHPHAGAGAYICGEETALIESLEGKRGMPRPRPPYPTTYGLFGKPTVVNNVETLTNVPPILRNGAKWYRELGSPKSTGTKVYTILGDVNFKGVIEVPMGITLREVIDIYGKGMKNGKKLKLVQTGGSSGTIAPASLQDTPLDFDSFRNAGVSLGSGALLVCDKDTCVVDLAKVILRFFRNECCGKCTPCRIGTLRLYEIVSQISEGKSTLDDLDLLMKISEAMSEVSNCGLGQTASVALRDILKYFREEIEIHIREHICPAGVCPISEPSLEPIPVSGEMS